jgi:hypothetical protein
MSNTIALTLPFVLINRLSLKWKIIWTLFWVFSISLLVSLVVFYIFQANSEISERYLTAEYLSRLDEVSEENKQLEITALSVNSLENVSDLLKTLNFVEVERIEYIRVLDNQVVSK